MDVSELIGRMREDVTAVRRVYGEPIERDGTTVIPVARVRGGGGAGNGEDVKEGGGGSGSGAGFAMEATPVGVYVVRDGKVSWQPAVDVNKIVLGGQIVGVVLLLTIRSLVRHLSRRD
jgi:uncharacterized spore protein YtfJ